MVWLLAYKLEWEWEIEWLQFYRRLSAVPHTPLASEIGDDRSPSPSRRAASSHDITVWYVYVRFLPYGVCDVTETYK